MIRSIRIASVALALLGWPLGSVATADPVTLQQCLAAQLRASGHGCRGVAKCYAKAMKEGTAVSTSCIDIKQDRMVSFAEEAEAVANCLVRGESTAVSEQIEMKLDEMAGDLGLSGGRCAAVKMKSIAKACTGYFRCTATADAHSTSLDPQCVAAHASRLDSNFTKLDATGNCVTTGDAPALQGKIATLVDAVRLVFRGTGTTTTTTATSSTLF